MDGAEQIDLGEALRARLAAAGLEVPAEDADRLERDLATHLERVAALSAAADLDPTDPPLTDPPPRPGGRLWTAARPPPAGRLRSPQALAPSPDSSAGASPGSPGSRAGANLPGAGTAGLALAPRATPGARARAGRAGADGAGGGGASSVELVERALERIDQLDGRVGAFVVVLAEQARAEARGAGRGTAAGWSPGRCTGCRWRSRT